MYQKFCGLRRDAITGSLVYNAQKFSRKQSQKTTISSWRRGCTARPLAKVSGRWELHKSFVPTSITTNSGSVTRASNIFSISLMVAPPLPNHSTACYAGGRLMLRILRDSAWARARVTKLCPTNKVRVGAISKTAFKSVLNRTNHGN